MFWYLNYPHWSVWMAVTFVMENCEEQFNFVLLSTHLGASILVLLALVLAMHTFTTKIGATIEEVLWNRPPACNSECKLPKFNAHRYPSIDELEPGILQSEPSYLEMGKSRTFNHVSRPKLFMASTLKKETLTRWKDTSYMRC